MKRTVLLLVVLTLLPGAVLWAQQPATPAATQEDFVPVNALPTQAEQLPAAPLVIAAYAFVWVAMLAYVWMLWKRMRQLERELTDLQRRVKTP
jgi:CcmD family protein